MKEHWRITDIIALLTVLCCFGYFFWVSFSPHARTQDSVVISIATALVAILPQVLSFYFGQAKKQIEQPGTTTTSTTIVPKEPIPTEVVDIDEKK